MIIKWVVPRRLGEEMLAMICPSTLIFLALSAGVLLFVLLPASVQPHGGWKRPSWPTPSRTLPNVSEVLAPAPMWA
jgi:hypothetical protein